MRVMRAAHSRHARAHIGAHIGACAGSPRDRPPCAGGARGADRPSPPSERLRVVDASHRPTEVSPERAVAKGRLGPGPQRDKIPREGSGAPATIGL